MSRSPKIRKRLDWEAARARLERLRESTGRAASPGADRIAEAFRRRAELLAHPARPAGELPGADAILIFRLAGERFAVPLARVSEILSNPSCTPVPGSPPEVAGVIQVRGEIRPVFELARLLGLPGKEEERASVLLLRGGAREFGARVASVEDIRLIPAADRQPAPDTLARHASWITTDLVPVLNIDSLFEGET
jgi:purine-binding chemotaxis protein CheW